MSDLEEVKADGLPPPLLTHESDEIKEIIDLDPNDSPSTSDNYEFPTVKAFKQWEDL